MTVAAAFVSGALVFWSVYFRVKYFKIENMVLPAKVAIFVYGSLGIGLIMSDYHLMNNIIHFEYKYLPHILLWPSVVCLFIFGARLQKDIEKYKEDIAWYRLGARYERWQREISAWLFWTVIAILVGLMISFVGLIIFVFTPIWIILLLVLIGIINVGLGAISSAIGIGFILINLAKGDSLDFFYLISVLPMPSGYSFALSIAFIFISTIVGAIEAAKETIMQWAQ